MVSLGGAETSVLKVASDPDDSSTDMRERSRGWRVKTRKLPAGSSVGAGDDDSDGDSGSSNSTKSRPATMSVRVTVTVTAATPPQTKKNVQLSLFFSGSHDGVR